MKIYKTVDRQIVTPPHSSSRSKTPIWRRLISAACITVVAYLLSLLLNQPFSFSAGAMMSSAERRDFNMSDFYNVVANSRPVCDLDTNIVIVDIAFTERDDVVDVLEILAGCNPKAVGIDVTFNDQHPGDERLIEAIANCPNAVMAVGVSGASGVRSTTFLPDDYSYFYNTACAGHSHGVVNFPTKFEGATIRQFRLSYPIVNGDPIPSFALALAQKAFPEKAAQALARGSEMETIDYPSRQFDIIPWYELPYNVDLVKDKIVLVGAINEDADTHVTPIDNRTSGVLIHALALSTIIRDAYYTVVPEWITMIISFLICFLLCFGNVTMKRSGARALWMRVIQFVGLYLILQIGYWLFIDRHIIFDFVYTLLMLLFGFFAVDIWFGLGYYADKILKKYKLYKLRIKL